MTQATVDMLSAKAKELAEKSSWVRSGLEKWLAMWETATAVDLKNETLQRLVVMEHIPRHSSAFTYYVERYQARLYVLLQEHYANGLWGHEDVFDIDETDMVVLRQVIKRLPSAIEKYIEALNAAGEDYDKLLALLPPGDRPPIKLTVHFWALPRPADEGAGWVADVIDVASQTMGFTDRCNDRGEALKAAREIASALEQIKEIE